MDLVEAAAPGCDVDFLGIRPGEKVHEMLISPDEARNTLETGDRYVIKPSQPWCYGDPWGSEGTVPADFHYGSDSNPWRLTGPQIRKLIMGCEGDGVVTVPADVATLTSSPRLVEREVATRR
jgi:UDP-N-acetylglucosamine 4,6-dehydratase